MAGDLIWASSALSPRTVYVAEPVDVRQIPLLAASKHAWHLGVVALLLARLLAVSSGGVLANIEPA